MNGTGQEKGYGLESRCRLSALALAIFASKEALDRVSTDADSCKHVMYNLILKHEVTSSEQCTLLSDSARAKRLLL